MSVTFYQSETSLESKWRALILFGLNAASYKFALANALLELSSNNKTQVNLHELAPVYVKSLLEHLKVTDKQGTSKSSTFLDTCRKYLIEEVSYDELIDTTVKYGFKNVIDAFHNVNADHVGIDFYTKDYSKSNKSIILNDSLYQLNKGNQVDNLMTEVEGRWNLVETAWGLNVNRNVLHVGTDDELVSLYLERDLMRRKAITSIRSALNGYQKGICFYSNLKLDIVKNKESICAVDHFFPHVLKPKFHNLDININGVWNLVLADKYVNLEKSARIPHIDYLVKLYNRNEYYIQSKHPLGESIVNQTGNTPKKRQEFLQRIFNISRHYIPTPTWKSSVVTNPIIL